MKIRPVGIKLFLTFGQTGQRFSQLC